jgi:hypothetical protein
LIGVAILLTSLGGCASSPKYENPDHPNYGTSEFDKDSAQCRRDNSKVTVRYGYDMASDVTVDEAGVKTCLAAKGWKPVAK